jgi:hypothetical protein
VPCQLTAELKECVDACQELLKCFEAEADGFLERNVMGDETWVHYHQLQTKKASKEWRHTSSPKPKNFAHNHLQERLCRLSFGMNAG